MTPRPPGSLRCPTPNSATSSARQLDDLKAKGLYKAERRDRDRRRRAGITRQRPRGRQLLRATTTSASPTTRTSSHAAHDGLEDVGLRPVQSVRFICGTQDVHKQCEQQIARFFGKGDSILYISCFDANGGLFEPLLTEQDAILSDELNHASIIDGVRLCKAQRFRYKHNDMADLKAKLEEAKGCRFKMIFTDSVFSWTATWRSCRTSATSPTSTTRRSGSTTATRTGHLGPTGRGAAEELGVLDRIDVITGTLGKTLGGASGGFTAAAAEVVDWLRNRSRPYLFSNSVPPALVVAGMKALDLVDTARRAARRS